jgi:NADH-quinone oxidoreductase subunit L
VVFIVGTLALAGVPPLAGFFSKEAILAGVWEGRMSGPFLMLALTAFLTAFYMFRVIFIAFGGAPAPAHGGGESHVHDAPPFMALPLWILAVLAVGAGIFLPLVHWESEFEALHWVTYAAITVAVLGIALAYLVYQRRAISADALARVFAPIRVAAVHRFWLDDLFAGIYRGIMLRLSLVVGWVDRYLVDGFLNVLSAWTLIAGDRLRRIQTGQPQDYVYGVALGVIALLVWMRWPR